MPFNGPSTTYGMPHAAAMGVNPAPLNFDFSKLGLPPGASVNSDGSILLPPDFMAGQLVNQTGGQAPTSPTTGAVPTPPPMPGAIPPPDLAAPAFGAAP